MSRQIFNLCCYGAAALCLLAGVICYAIGFRFTGVILSVAAVTFVATYVTDRRHRIIFSTSKKPKPSAIPPMGITGADGKLTVKCGKCGRENVFDQPFAYHAGFAEQGFIYSNSGHFTLVWSWNDPVMNRYRGIDAYPSVAHCFPPVGKAVQERDAEMRRRFEDALRPAPDGSRWHFKNPARCIFCSEPISGSMFQTVHYLVYPGSVVTDGPGGAKLEDYLAKPHGPAPEAKAHLGG